MSISAMDAKILRIIEESTCFGIGHDPKVKECMMCDVQEQCRAKTQGLSVPTPQRKKPEEVAVPETPKKEKAKKPTTTKKTATKKSTEVKEETRTKAKTTAKKPKKSTVTDPNMPVFKDMTLEQLKDLAKERNVEWRDYGSDQITRMRLTMALKASYK